MSTLREEGWWILTALEWFKQFFIGQCGFLACVFFTLCSSASAQQNFFNVPSGTITQKHEIFLQEQVNLGRFGESNFTVDYGLGNDWEVGLNIFKVSLYPGSLSPQPGDANEDSLLMNIQRVFHPFEKFDFEIGTQNGISANNANRRSDFVDFTWGVSRWTPKESWFSGSFVAGPYYGNKNYLGSGNEFGYLLGVEVPVFDEKFAIVGDYLSGTNSASVGVIGFQWYLSRELGWQISLGGQLPAPGSGNDYGAVFELTKLPPSLRVLK